MRTAGNGIKYISNNMDSIICLAFTNYCISEAQLIFTYFFGFFYFLLLLFLMSRRTAAPESAAVAANDFGSKVTVQLLRQ